MLFCLSHMHKLMQSFSTQVFQSSLVSLHHIMAGFGIPDNPYFTEFLNNSVSSLLKTLKDPALPLMEMRVSINIYIRNTLLTLRLLSLKLNFKFYDHSLSS